MKKVAFVVCLLVLCVGLPLAFAGNWWEEDQNAAAKSTVQVQKTQGQGGQKAASMINWEDGYIEAVGMATIDMTRMKNKAQAEIMAMEGARAMAYARLSEAINGVAVTSEILVEQALTTDQYARTKTQAIIKGARILEEKVIWGSDAPLGMCRLGLVLRGAGGVQAPLVDSVLRNKTEKAPLFQPATPPTPAGVTHTGIVIDARGLGLKPAMIPEIYTEDGKLVYGASVVDPQVAQQQGLVSFASSLDSANVAQRVGANPLVIKAAGVAGAQSAGVKITTADALKTLAENVGGGLLKMAKVLFLL